MTQPAPVTIAHAWQDALNMQDVDTLLALSDPAIEIVGPRGTVRGHDILRDWLSRAGATFQTQRTFASGNTVVIAQHGVWRSVETGGLVGEADVASLFRLEEGRVIHYARYDTLEEALAKAGLEISDELQ